jgi:hypothetical protein
MWGWWMMFSTTYDQLDTPALWPQTASEVSELLIDGPNVQLGPLSDEPASCRTLIGAVYRCQPGD